MDYLYKNLCNLQNHFYKLNHLHYRHFKFYKHLYNYLKHNIDSHTLNRKLMKFSKEEEAKFKKENSYLNLYLYFSYIL